MSSKMDALMSEVNKKVKEEIISKGLADFSGYKKIPFTSPRINYSSYGGVPVGKLIEFYGAEHGGKTTSALDIVANFQKIEKQRAEENSKYTPKDVLYCDVENSLDSEWAEKLGVDTDSMYLLQPKAQSAEDIFNLITDAIETGDIGLVILDSIAAMVSEDELEKGYDDKSFGGISGPLSRFAKKVAMLTTKYSCTLIGINQVRDDVNSTWGGYKTPGGRAWKHMCVARFEFSKGKYLDDKGNDLTNGTESPAAMKIMYTMPKNKTCPPNRRTGFYTINFDIGVDYLADLIEVAMKYGIVIKSGAWFTIPQLTDEKIQGQGNVKTYLEEHPDILEGLDDLVKEQIK